MTVRAIARHFEGLGKVPIDVNDVLAQVRALLPDEVIDIYGINADPQQLRGTCLQWKVNPPTGSAMMSTKHSAVIYSTRLAPEWQRLVCCKELIHVLDPEPVRTTSKDEVLQLIEKMSSKTPIFASTPNHLGVFVDKIAEWQAVSIMFPYGMWEEVYERHTKHGLKCQQIASWLELPHEKVEVVLNDIWKHMYHTILSHS